MNACSRVILNGDRPISEFTISPSVKYNRFYIESFSVPPVFNNLPATVVNFQDGAAINHVINMSAGRWDLESWLDTLVTIMNSVDSLGNTYSTAITSGWVWAMTVTAGSFILNVVDPIVQQRIGLIGSTTSVGLVLTSSKFMMSPVYLTIETNLPIDSQSISYANQNSPALPVNDIARSGGSICFLHTPNNCNPITPNTGLPERWHGERVSTQDRLFGSGNLWTGIDRINVTIRDDLGMPVDTYPQRWCLVFVFYNGSNSEF